MGWLDANEYLMLETAVSERVEEMQRPLTLPSPPSGERDSQHPRPRRGRGQGEGAQNAAAILSRMVASGRRPAPAFMLSSRCSSLPVPGLTHGMDAGRPRSPMAH